MKLLLLIPVLLLSACSASQEQAFLTNAPAVISGTLATANDLYAAYAAANQQLNGQSLNVTTGLSAANAAEGSLASNSANLSTAVQSVFDGLNSLSTAIKAANPAATTSQIVAAQSAQLVAAQTATAAAAPATSTAMLRIHWNRIADKFVVAPEKKA